MKNPGRILLVIIPLAYAAVAAVLAWTTDVFAPASRPKFVVLYAALAVVSGVSDLFQMKFETANHGMQERAYFRATIRGHWATLLFVFFGAAAAFLLDIDTGWPEVLGFVCGPVTGRALTFFSTFTMQLASRVWTKVSEVGVMLMILWFVLALVRGR